MCTVQCALCTTKKTNFQAIAGKGVKEIHWVEKNEKKVESFLYMFNVYININMNKLSKRKGMAKPERKWKFFVCVCSVLLHFNIILFFLQNTKYTYDILNCNGIHAYTRREKEPYTVCDRMLLHIFRVKNFESSGWNRFAYI